MLHEDPACRVEMTENKKKPFTSPVREWRKALGISGKSSFHGLGSGESWERLKLCAVPLTLDIEIAIEKDALLFCLPRDPD